MNDVLDGLLDGPVIDLRYDPQADALPELFRTLF